MDREEIDNRFGYHPPRSQKRVGQHQVVRNLFRNIAMSLVDLLPEGREKSTCITRLEEAMFWANAALARSPDPDATASEEEAAAGPREEEPRCTAIASTTSGVCDLPAFGYIIMGGGKKRPMCEYHWCEDGSGHAKERIR